MYGKTILSSVHATLIINGSGTVPQCCLPLDMHLLDTLLSCHVRFMRIVRINRFKFGSAMVPRTVDYVELRIKGSMYIRLTNYYIHKYSYG